MKIANWQFIFIIEAIAGGNVFGEKGEQGAREEMEKWNKMMEFHKR